MKLLKKFIAAVMTVVMTAGMFAVNAGAVSFDSAKQLYDDEEVTVTLKQFKDVGYKILPTKAGKLKLSFSMNSKRSEIGVYGPSGTLLKPSKVSMSKGKATVNDDNMVVTEWKASTTDCKGTITYDLPKKDTYLIRIYKTSMEDAELTLKASFPTSSVATISHFTLTMRKGDVVQLGAAINGQGKVVWTSSKKSVVVVSKGKITAKGRGTATVTATVGKTSLKIIVTVK